MKQDIKICGMVLFVFIFIILSSFGIVFICGIIDEYFTDKKFDRCQADSRFCEIEE